MSVFKKWVLSYFCLTNKPMILSEINKADILKTFKNHNNFNNEITYSLKYLSCQDRFDMASIIIYYNVIFVSGGDMIHDNLIYKDMAADRIELMKRGYKIKPLRIFKFLENRIIENQLYVSKIKKLA